MTKPFSVVDALELAKRELIFVGGCTLTDRPDLPLSPETSWTMDMGLVLRAIDDAIDQLVGADRRTELGSVGCSKSQPMRPFSSRTRSVQVRRGSRKADGDLE